MPLVFKWRGRTANHSSFFFPYTGPKTVGQLGRRLGPGPSRGRTDFSASAGSPMVESSQASGFGFGEEC